MNTNHQMDKNQKSNSGKNGFIKCKIPIIEIPKNEEMFNCFLFNEENKSIELYFIKKDSMTIIRKYKMENFPVEKCNKCKSDLSIDNLSFLLKDNNNTELYCGNCGKENNSVNKFQFPVKTSPINNQIIGSLNSFLEKNKSESTQAQEYIKIMENLISFTNIIILLLNQIQSNKAFQRYVLFYQSYLDNLNSYLETISNFKMDNLFLFIKNFFVSFVDKIDEQFLYGNIKFYLDNINKFNTSDILFQALKNKFKSNQNLSTILFETVELKIEQKKKILIQDFNEINYDYFSLKNEINKRKINWLRKKIRINELKENIIDFLRNYNYSYNYISSKKVLERKFINEILYLLFKYNYDRFQMVGESVSIMNSIQKELKNVLKFLDNKENNKVSQNSIMTDLKKDIQNEINFWEGKKEKKDIWKRSSNTPIKRYKKIVLSNEARAILDEYISSLSEDSFTSILVSKNNDNSKEISSEKIQAILEFLFFIRDKTIDTIHILNKTAPLFFDFLNQDSLDKKIENDDEFLEELQKDFNNNFSKEEKNINEVILNKLSVKPIDKIECFSALDFIFNSRSNNDYINEIKYLYENVVLPEREGRIILNNEENEEENNSYYLTLQKKIGSLYNELDSKFKLDPLYDIIIKYFIDFSNAKKKNKRCVAPQKIQFYEKYVDNFLDFKKLFILKMEVNDYLKIIESQDKTLAKMEIIKKNFKNIKKEIKNYLKPNEENYMDYYLEFKKRNKSFVIENYELKDLIKDLKQLIPKTEVINISGKDKKNFLLILYLFQNDNFLKDYI